VLRRHPIRILLLSIALMAIAVRIIPALAGTWISNDAIEYLDIARRLVDGEGLTLSIKAYHFVDTAIIHYAGYDRPPLFPLLLAAWMALVPLASAPALLNTLLAVLGAVLAADLARRLYGLRTAWAYGVLVALAPALVFSSLHAWSEPLAFALAMLAVWTAVARPATPRGLMATGVAMGLAFLARPTTAWVSMVVTVWVVLVNRTERPRPPARFGLLLAGILPFALLQVALNLAHGAPPLTTAQQYLFRAVRYTDGVYRFPWELASSPLALVREQPYEVALQVYRHLRDYSRELFLSWQWLGLLTLGVPLVPWRAAKRQTTRARLLIFILGAAGFAFICLSWPSHDLIRFPQLPYAFLLLAVLGEAREWAGGVRRFHHPALVAWWAAAAVMAGAYLLPSIDYARQALRSNEPLGNLPANWLNPGAPELMAWIKATTAPDATFASTNPWPIAWRTHRPAVLLPQGMNETELRAFLEGLGVRYVVLNRRYPLAFLGEEPEYGAWLRRWSGGRPFEVGSYQIFSAGGLVEQGGA